MSVMTHKDVARFRVAWLIVVLMGAPIFVSPAASAADLTLHGLDRVGHIIVLMQENHSFDNYFGSLPYVRGGHYHAPLKPGRHANLTIINASTG